jgi:hypothetical protein
MIHCYPCSSLTFAPRLASASSSSSAPLTGLCRGTTHALSIGMCNHCSAVARDAGTGGLRRNITNTCGHGWHQGAQPGRTHGQPQVPSIGVCGHVWWRSQQGQMQMQVATASPALVTMTVTSGVIAHSHSLLPEEPGQPQLVQLCSQSCPGPNDTPVHLHQSLLP